jgi:nicotinamidase-related amidase
MLNINDAVLVIIDVQEKLFRVMNDKEMLVKNLQALVKGIQILEVPIILTEQNPDGLGPTIAEVAELTPAVNRIPKFSFSCCGEERFLRELNALNRKQAVITGIETHVCVYQTAVDLIGLGYYVQVVADCVSSRAFFNSNIALERLKTERIVLTSTEMVLFELLKTAENPRLKDIQNIIK